MQTKKASPPINSNDRSAARNEKGEVIMYADKITDSMQYALDETQRRRDIQMAHNEKYGITPKTINKKIS